MKILGRSHDMVHTHFLTDCIYLPEDRGREIKRQLGPLLRELRIVYGIHFRETAGQEGLTIVLECIPFRETLDRIEARLKEIVKDMPSRPRRTHVKVESPLERKKRNAT